MIDLAVDFVLSKINLSVGVRDKNATVDVHYELPIQAVTEAIVNAVAHRDYTSNASVQVMLFADRLEIWNPGSLLYGLTVDKLFIAHSSIPANPLLAEPMYLKGTIERMGTGTQEIVRRCNELHLRRPDFIQNVEFKTILYRPAPSLVANETNQGVVGNVVGNVVDNVVGNVVDKRLNAIIQLITKNNQISAAQIADILNTSSRTIQRDLLILKKENKIRRVGNEKSGHWEIIDADK